MLTYIVTNCTEITEVNLCAFVYRFFHEYFFFTRWDRMGESAILVAIIYPSYHQLAHADDGSRKDKRFRTLSELSICQLCDRFVSCCVRPAKDCAIEILIGLKCAVN